jgi:DNA-binding CsgD family transcriptional regulator
LDGVFNKPIIDFCEREIRCSGGLIMIQLTKKEAQILRLIADGKKSEQIAEALCLSLPTIKWYRKRLRDKFEAGTTVEMIRKAIHEGIV